MAKVTQLQSLSRLCALFMLSGLALLQPTATTTARIQQPAPASTNERDRGIDLYQKGDNKSALDALRRAVKQDQNDLAAWHYLGLALEKKGDTGGAKKAHEKAAKLGQAVLDRLLDQTPNGTEIPRALLPVQANLVQAAESAERYVALDPKLSKSKLEDWNKLISSLRGFSELAGDQALKIYSPKEVDTKVRVLSKPLPTYTEQARGHRTSGTVSLRCIFGAKGKIFGIRVVAGLPDGLTERAVQTAYQIKFIPATKDGKPVSMYMQVEYNFNIY